MVRVVLHAGTVRCAAEFLGQLHAAPQGMRRLQVAVGAARGGHLANLPHEVLCLVVPSCLAALHAVTTAVSYPGMAMVCHPAHTSRREHRKQNDFV